jgi:hypothetical protein
MRCFMQNQTLPPWMEDSLVQSIPKEKLRFLEQMFLEGQGKSQKELMSFLLPMMKKAKQENLTFTPQEIQAAISAIRKYSTIEENRKIDKILKKAGAGES